MSDMKMFGKLMEKKGKGSLDPEYKSAKMDVLKALHKEMGDMMGSDLHGLKKVTVAAPDKEGLAEGLDKAEDMLAGGGEAELPEAGEEDEDEMSSEEIDAKIRELEMLKMKKMKV